MPSGTRKFRSVVLPLASVTAVFVISLAACTSAPPPSASPSTTPSASNPSVAPPPVLQPTLGAKQNLAYFDFINKGTLAANPNADGKAFIDGLVAAGFAKADMQVTADRTSANLAADSIQFSVRINGTCLIGQNGVGSSGYQSIATTLLATGNCLIGNTRPIDW